MILISCQEMDVIELFKTSFSRSEKWGLANFPIIIDNNSNDSKIVVKKVQFELLSSISANISE